MTPELFHQPFQPGVNACDDTSCVEVRKEGVKGKFWDDHYAQINRRIYKRLDSNFGDENSKHVENECIDKQGKYSECNEIYRQTDKSKNRFNNKKH